MARLSRRIEKLARFYARKSGEDADDLLQEAWLGLLEGLRENDPAIGDPFQYLIQRARWRVLDAIKRARVRKTARLGDGEGPAVGDAEWARPPTEVPAEAAAAGEFVRALDSAQRNVLDCLLLGYTTREAGARLGCSSANVCYHVRALRRRYEAWSAGA
ncbi:MAG: sigma-70 family RNA polymerase sigma factor [Planctomycetes bacterium]|nr:sigma-70 family RNA polymerase sigma factor [Planctomycetota bacterium]